MGACRERVISRHLASAPLEKNCPCEFCFLLYGDIFLFLGVFFYIWEVFYSLWGASPLYKKKLLAPTLATPIYTPTPPPYVHYARAVPSPSASYRFSPQVSQPLFSHFLALDVQKGCNYKCSLEVFNSSTVSRLMSPLRTSPY